MSLLEGIAIALLVAVLVTAALGGLLRTTVGPRPRASGTAEALNALPKLARVEQLEAFGCRIDVMNEGRVLMMLRQASG